MIYRIRSQRFLCLFITILLFSSCSVSHTESEGNIEWLNFSTTEFEAERQAVKNWYSDDFQVLRDTNGNSYIVPPIYIAKKDIDCDGDKELIVYMVGTIWGGGSASGSLEVMYYDESSSKILKDIRIANFQINPDTLDKNSKQVGVKKQNDGFYDFIILGDLWDWR